MNCPKCNAKKCGVIDSRKLADNTVRRRRECRGCGYRFTSLEMTIVDLAKLKKV